MDGFFKRKISDRLKPVSPLAIGSLTVSSMQAALPLSEASDVISYAFECGINFIDTAQYYSNYDIILSALKKYGKPDDIVISTKTYAYSRDLAVEAVEEARRELDRDVIDIFMLHEQESYETMKGHMEAYEYLLECREKGIIRAVGASTHHVNLVNGLLKLIREGLPVDICHPLYNKSGIGIADGTERDMKVALTILHDNGVAVFAMKALGGGHLCSSAEEALGFVTSKKFIDAVAIGMQSREEVDANIRYFKTGSFSPEDRIRLGEKHRELHIEEYCEGCGSCVRRCPSGALELVEAEDNDAGAHYGDFTSLFMGGKEYDTVKHVAKVDNSKCVKCGYCTKVCPVFALKVY